jgi:transketolase
MEVRKLNQDELQEMCRTVRADILTMVHEAGSGHIGGSLSSVELMVCLYFGGILSVFPEDPENPARDRFILSKGHVAPVLYSVLARKSFFPPEELRTLRRLGSILQGHPHRGSTPGLDCSAGSLGQGLSIANGLGLAFQRNRQPNRVYCLLGDGELQEGQVWEAAMTAPQHHLDNVCAIVDCNRIQLDGSVASIKNLDSLAARWKDFGWNVLEIDGHSIPAVLEAYRAAAQTRQKPTVILADTVKGKGVSFMENQSAWHGQAPNDAQYRQAMAEVLKGGKQE